MHGINPRPKIEFQKLLQLCKANEESKNFNLRTWLQSCGTFGCLVGNDWCANKENRPYLQHNVGSRDISGTQKEYGLTKNEFRFLFMGRDNTHSYYPQLGCTIHALNGKPRHPLDKTAAINRVRKFIYYHLHKQEVMATETARHIEGDWMLTEKVTRQLTKQGETNGSCKQTVLTR